MYFSEWVKVGFIVIENLLRTLGHVLAWINLINSMDEKDIFIYF